MHRATIIKIDLLGGQNLVIPVVAVGCCSAQRGTDERTIKPADLDLQQLSARTSLFFWWKKMEINTFGRGNMHDVVVASAPRKQRRRVNVK